MRNRKRTMGELLDGEQHEREMQALTALARDLTIEDPGSSLTASSDTPSLRLAEKLRAYWDWVDGCSWGDPHVLFARAPTTGWVDPDWPSRCCSDLGVLLVLRVHEFLHQPGDSGGTRTATKIHYHPDDEFFHLQFSQQQYIYIAVICDGN